MLFTAAVREHERRTQGLRAAYESESRAALGKVHHLADALVDLANVDVSRIYDLQLQIESEARAVRGEVAALERNLGEVAAAVRHLSDSLKHLGDFENYVSVLGERVDRVARALDQKRSQQPQQQAAQPPQQPRLAAAQPPQQPQQQRW